MNLMPNEKTTIVKNYISEKDREECTNTILRQFGGKTKVEFLPKDGDDWPARITIYPHSKPATAWEDLVIMENKLSLIVILIPLVGIPLVMLLGVLFYK